jgi:hypothetical protein
MLDFENTFYENFIFDSVKIILLLILPITSNCQVVYEGYVFAKTSKKQISYATIALYKANKVTSADEYGKFIISATKYDDDTLIISSVGYNEIKIPVSSIPRDNKFELEEKNILLSTITIVGNKLNSSWLNEYSNCGNNSFTVSGTTIMLAQSFLSPTENFILKEISLCKESGNSKFRIRILGFDTISLKPSTDLINTIIEINSTKRHINVDLRPYKIHIFQRQFFIAIEWLYIPFNEKKVKTKFYGEKITRSEFAPYLLIKQNRNINEIDKSNKLWHLDHRGKWSVILSSMKLAVSARIEY